MLDSGYLRIGRRHPGGRRLDLLRAGPALQPQQPLVGRPHPLLGAGEACPGHIPPGCGIVALFLRARVGLEERVEAGEVRRGGRQVVLGARDVRLGTLHLGLRLPNLFRAGARLQQPQLRRGLVAVGLGASKRQLRVGDVKRGDDLVECHAVALGNLEFDQPTADFRGHLHLGGLDAAGSPDAVGRGLLAAGGEREADDERGGEETGTVG